MTEERIIDIIYDMVNVHCGALERYKHIIVCFSCKTTKYTGMCKRLDVPRTGSYVMFKFSPDLLLMKTADAMDVILHELAHALSPTMDHGKVWKQIFIDLGGSGSTLVVTGRTRANMLQKIKRAKCTET